MGVTDRMRRLIVATALLGICLASATARADGRGASRCTWGPITDVPAAQALLAKWVAATNLPPFEKDKSGLGIDRSSVRVILRFDQGAITLAWEIDDDCKPTAVTIDASPDYEGTRPDAAAVKQLAVSFGSVTVEQHLGARSFAAPHVRVLVLGVGAVLAGLLLLARRGRRALKMKLGVLAPLEFARLRGMSASSRIRLLGLVAIVVLLPYESAPAGNWLYADSVILLGVLPLMVFLWLAVSGFFGYGSPERSDWVALVPCLVGLIACEAFTLHSIEEIELHFYTGYLPDKNSILHPLFQMFMGRFAKDPYAFMMHLNGIMEAVAVLPLFLFVRHRTGSRLAAFVTAFFFALQPVTTRFAPTDGPYALIFLSWFSGLALLSAREIGGRQLFAGATLLAIAATCRLEGLLYLAASVLLLDVRAVIRAVSKSPLVAVLSASTAGVLVGVHWVACLPLDAIFTLTPHQTWPTDHLTWNSFRDSAFGPARNDLLFRVLIVVGALAGVVDRRLRIGLGAVLGSLLVILPMSQSGDSGILPLHRLVPVCGLQAIAAGVGAFWICNFVPARLKDNWTIISPALIVALYIFIAHRAELSVRYVFNEEFEMLRERLAPDGVPNTNCSLLSFSGVMDSDLHSAWQVVPGMHVLDCRKDDCRKEAEQGGCTYYFRSVSCYLLPYVEPAACAARGMTAEGDRLPCIEEECASLEKSLQLSPVDERTVYPHGVWGKGEMATRFPDEAGVGLYRVLAVKNTATVVLPTH